MLSSFLVPKRRATNDNNLLTDISAQRNEISNITNDTNGHSEEESRRTEDNFVMKYLLIILIYYNAFSLCSRTTTCVSMQNSSFRKKKNQV